MQNQFIMPIYENYYFKKWGNHDPMTIYYMP